jgi:hypothetical protein
VEIKHQQPAFHQKQNFFDKYVLLAALCEADTLDQVLPAATGVKLCCEQVLPPSSHPQILHLALLHKKRRPAKGL